jgi:A/G-specific adenine glycosylase
VSLVRWFAANRRELPWRTCRNPYRIWVSEIMLQQTTVAAVVPYFERWMDELPTLEALANAPIGRVMRLFEGLGYYSRVRRLHEAARLVVQDHGGTIPPSASALQRLPGIGRYTAGAIASIAFGLPEPIVDTNAARVLSRVFMVEGLLTLPAVQRALWSHAKQLVQLAPPSEVNQGLMDFGASLCTPQNPHCSECPLRPNCLAHAKHRVAEFPQLPKRSPPKTARVVVAIVEHRGRFLILPRPPGETPWSGLFTFPFGILGDDDSPELAARGLVAPYATLESHSLHPHDEIFRYTIVRTRYSAHVVRLVAKTRPRVSPPSARWVRLSELADLALPAPHRRLAKSLDGTGPSPSPHSRH